jgi:hypothetical protein
MSSQLKKNKLFTLFYLSGMAKQSKPIYFLSFFFPIIIIIVLTPPPPLDV